jgi:SAM-dependent methyltransferase
VTAVLVSGTEGYGQEVQALFERAERIAFAEKHAPVLHLMPIAPSRVLDVGAGTGRDAADFAAMGHRVLAVEPTFELRTRASALRASPLIEWLDDSLPDLTATVARGETFDLVLLSAVWMHLDEDQRRRAMSNIARLARTDGVVILSLRHGPVPAGRRMFEVSGAETIRLAQAGGLRLAVNAQVESVQPANRLAGVTWTLLGFVKTESSTA